MSNKLSKNHGLNPSIDICFFCREPKGLAMFGHIKGDKKAPQEICTSIEPCEACKAKFEEEDAIAFVEVIGNSKEDLVATGTTVVVKKSFVQRLQDNQIIQIEIIEPALANNRLVLIDCSAMQQLGLVSMANDLSNNTLDSNQNT